MWKYVCFFLSEKDVTVWLSAYNHFTLTFHIKSP